MNYIPMLFSTPMVQAILSDLKTQTRRVIKPQPLYELKQKENGKWHEWCSAGADVHTGSVWGYEYKPPCQVGDIIWVRETWAERVIGSNKRYFYRADLKVCDGHRPSPYYDCPNNASEAKAPCELCEYEDGYIRWKPSIHMPREAARLFLRVTDLRVERLWDISIDDILKEGIEMIRVAGSTNYRHLEEYEAACDEATKESFITLWDSINAKRNNGAYSWEQNPWVWTISFERIEKPDDWGRNS